eukprot:TRINITY_DN7748_c0_g1_i1.p1 TRINITY_DN7748_c0_g1~~TRINITY_DN7748_c0_g1_i1.p1  ORF type:complete len:112 (-),score=15.74 TRINITY_DN7748_c0_g1_i1:79-414(-)
MTPTQNVILFLTVSLLIVFTWAQTCEEGYYGTDCAPCQCVNGTCRDGYSGDGTCLCFDGYHGIFCNVEDKIALTTVSAITVEYLYVGIAVIILAALWLLLLIFLSPSVHRK